MIVASHTCANNPLPCVIASELILACHETMAIEIQDDTTPEMFSYLLTARKVRS